jgi:phage-related holin
LAIGCVLSFFISDLMNLKKTILLFVFAILCMFIDSLVGNTAIIIASLLFYIFIFCSIEVFFEKELEYNG